MCRGAAKTTLGLPRVVPATYRVLSVCALVAMAAALPISATASCTLLVPEEYATIQEAVDAAVSGCVVSIAPGLYRETVILNTDGVVLESRGQEATTATTEITGDNGDGTNRPYVILCGASTGATTEVRYLKITGASSSTGLRGGIVIEGGSSVLIRDSIITGNSSGGLSPYTGGGGVHCMDSSSPTIRHNTIADNYGYWGGGAVYCGASSTVVIEDNILSMNSSRYDGGAVRCDPGSDVLIQRNEIVGNQNSTYSSGGIYTEAALCQILANVLVGNEVLSASPSSRGGGVSVEEGTAVIASNIFGDNRVPAACDEFWGCSKGGAIYVDGVIATPSATITNNTIYGSSASEGSAIYIGDRVGSVVVRNNIAASSGDGCAFGSAVPVDSDYNCLWDNACDYEGAWTAGANDLSVAPEFVDYPAGDVHLLPTSPCIDAGEDSLVGPDDVDMDGQPRIYGPHVDIGADEVWPQLWFEDDDPAITYIGAWAPYNHPAASAGHLKYSGQTGARIEFCFYGTGVRWHTARGPMGGEAKVWLDGAGPLVVDLYRPSLQLVTLEKTGLPLGWHCVVIEVTEGIVAVDAFEVVP